MNNARIFIALLLFLTSYICEAQEQDSIKSIMLQEVAVKGNLRLYKASPDAIIYDVSSDSSLIGKNSFEALRNAPLLNVARNGTVRSVGDWPIEYNVNGGQDILFSGNIRDALESLDSKYLKSIEVRLVRNMNGEEQLRVNFVTKGRILGYRGVMRSEVSDDRWRNGTYLFTKKNHVGFSLSYYNTWIWAHNSNDKSEEWRYNSENRYYTTSETKDFGYKADLNNIEMNFSYDLTPLKVFSIFGRAMLKANPQDNSVTSCKVEDKYSQQSYRYIQNDDYKLRSDAEYDFSVDYEQLFGENAERGKFYVGYEFYSRPIKIRDNGYYTLLEYNSPEYVQDFYDCITHKTEREDWHTLTLTYRRKGEYHSFYLEDFLRYRKERYDVSQTKQYKYALTPYDKTDGENYKYSQLANCLKIGYGYTAKKFGLQTGTNYWFVRDESNGSASQSCYSANRQFITPYLDMSYTLNSQTRFNLSYGMGKQLPDISALNPYVYANTPGQLSYGNPNLKAQTMQTISFSSYFRLGKINLHASLSTNFVKDIILRHSFLKDDILHITNNNIGRKFAGTTKISASSKITRTTWVQADANLSYTHYAKNDVYKSNQGWTFNTNAYIEQELPLFFDISLGGGYNTPDIYMQGRGSSNFYYNLCIDKTFNKQRITISAEARSFLPIHYTSTSTSSSTGYYYYSRSRSYHASFTLSLNWRFGKLNAEEHKTDEERYGHKDIKRDYNE